LDLVKAYQGIEINMNGVGTVDVEIYRNPYSELNEYWMYCPAVFHEAYCGRADDDFRAVQSLLYRKVLLRFIKEGIQEGTISRKLLFSVSEINTTLAIPAAVEDEYKDDADFSDLIVHHYNHTIVPAGIPYYHERMFGKLKIAEEFRRAIRYDYAAGDWIVDLIEITGRVSDIITGSSSAHTRVLRESIFREFAEKVVEDDLFGNSEGSDIERWQGEGIQALIKRYMRRLGAVDYVELFVKLVNDKVLRRQFIKELLEIKRLQKKAFIEELLKGTFGEINFSQEDLERDHIDLMNMPFFTFVRRLVDYKCVDLIIDLLYDPAFRERIIKANAVIFIGGRKFDSPWDEQPFGQTQQNRIKELIEQDSRLKYRIIFISNHKFLNFFTFLGFDGYTLIPYFNLSDLLTGGIRRSLLFSLSV
jgi:glucan phosphorylase